MPVSETFPPKSTEANPSGDEAAGNAVEGAGEDEREDVDGDDDKEEADGEGSVTKETQSDEWVYSCVSFLQGEHDQRKDANRSSYSLLMAGPRVRVFLAKCEHAAIICIHRGRWAGAGGGHLDPLRVPLRSYKKELFSSLV